MRSLYHSKLRRFPRSPWGRRRAITASEYGKSAVADGRVIGRAGTRRIPTDDHSVAPPNVAWWPPRWPIEDVSDGGGTRRRALPGVAQSAGRVATCFDNSVAEAFWSSLKRELVHRYSFATRDQAKAAITAWIKRYNAVRLHSSLGYVPPIEWELNYYRQQLQAA